MRFFLCCGYVFSVPPCLCVEDSDRGKDGSFPLELSDGRGMRKAMEFMFPYIADETRWPQKTDVQYHENWPVRHPSLLFAGLALDRPAYRAMAVSGCGSTVDEVIRNFVVRQPLLWISEG